jgi:hypothetical protein
MRHLWPGLCLLFFVTVWGDPPKKGVDRWRVKTTLDSAAEQKKPKSVKSDDLITLAEPDRHQYDYNEYQHNQSHENDRMRNPSATALQEGDLVSTTGYVQLIASEDDGDYHIQIGPTREDRTKCVIVEVPRSDFLDAPDAKLGGLDTLRAKLLKNFGTPGKPDFSGSGTCVKHPTKMKITGQLFYDVHHAIHPGPRGKGLCDASHNFWEIHPVYAMTFAEKKTGQPEVACK